MCIVNHAVINAGYLISAKVESFAPPVILTRVLQNYREIELSNEQIRRLLDLAKEYQEEYLKVSIEFSNVTANLDLVEAKADIQLKRQLLDRHAKLFREHENLMLDAYERTQKILNQKQMRKAMEIYERDKQKFLDGVESNLKKAMAPKLEVVRRTGSRKVK